MDSSGNSLAIQILIIVVLTFINAIFAASELAFVSVNQNKIKNIAEDGNKQARRVQSLLKRSDNFLATIQVAITLAGFLSSASAATSFVDIIIQWLPNFPFVRTISLIIVTVILSYISLVFGELYPKQIALQMPEKVAMKLSGIIMISQKIFKPFVIFLSMSTNLLKRITPMNFQEKSEKFTREEMQAVLHESHNEGSIDVDEFTMLKGVLSLDDKVAREIMVPRTDTQMIDILDSSRENIHEILESPYSRMPIYEDDKDNILGILHVKKLLNLKENTNFDEVNLLELTNAPFFIPSTMYIDDLLVAFKREQQHMAIVIDEYGGVDGIVTLEDLIEEIVGEIDDETDIQPTVDVRKIDDTTYYVNAGIGVDEFNEYFNTNILKGDVDTIAGVVIREIGFVPSSEEKVKIRLNQYILTITKVDNGRIYEIRVIEDSDHHMITDYHIEQEEGQVEKHDSSDDE